MTTPKRPDLDLLESEVDHAGLARVRWLAKAMITYCRDLESQLAARSEVVPAQQEAAGSSPSQEGTHSGRAASGEVEEPLELAKLWMEEAARLRRVNIHIPTAEKMERTADALRRLTTPPSADTQQVISDLASAAKALRGMRMTREAEWCDNGIATLRRLEWERHFLGLENTSLRGHFVSHTEENQRLRARVEEAEAELERRQAKVMDLRARVEELEAERENRAKVGRVLGVDDNHIRHDLQILGAGPGRGGALEVVVSLGAARAQLAPVEGEVRELAENIELGHEEDETEGGYCARCFVDWPCYHKRAATALRNLARERDWWKSTCEWWSAACREAWQHRAGAAVGAERERERICERLYESDRGVLGVEGRATLHQAIDLIRSLPPLPEEPIE